MLSLGNHWYSCSAVRMGIVLYCLIIEFDKYGRVKTCNLVNSFVSNMFFSSVRLSWR